MSKADKEAALVDNFIAEHYPHVAAREKASATAESVLRDVWGEDYDKKIALAARCLRLAGK